MYLSVDDITRRQIFRRWQQRVGKSLTLAASYRKKDYCHQDNTTYRQWMLPAPSASPSRAEAEVCFYRVLLDTSCFFSSTIISWPPSTVPPSKWTSHSDFSVSIIQPIAPTFVAALLLARSCPTVRSKFVLATVKLRPGYDRQVYRSRSGGRRREYRHVLRPYGTDSDWLDY
ncbi:hypothetical protein CPB84DRAFT_287666 [Gymnopilus junonius]|uniref:Uncharacterized protein n=1 Tax=Gymnopilus junonius TaxID=109634 RepID=A0A9P5NF44_GYMJU|nr:hypothetical protein CPB84DRAFT_287666 [Gymnopilus junonius]